MPGFEVLRSLRASKVKTPILILSGLAGIEDKVKGLAFGADDYMTKPFHKDGLVASMRLVTDNAMNKLVTLRRAQCAASLPKRTRAKFCNALAVRASRRGAFTLLTQPWL
jgi:DNA-binding response OmpR family regulator